MFILYSIIVVQGVLIFSSVVMYVNKVSPLLEIELEAIECDYWEVVK